MKKTGVYVSIILGLCCVFAVTSCATSVPVTVTRPSEFDLNGAKSISVLPFQTSSSKNLEETGNKIVDVINVLSYIFDNSDPEEVNSAEYLTDQLNQRLSNSSYLTLVSSTVVKNALESRRKAPVDVYLTGKFKDFMYRTDTEDVKETKSGKTYYVTKYKKYVSTTVIYQIINARTNEVIGYRNVDLDETSQSYDSRKELPRAYDLIKGDLDNLTRKILKEIQPYEETKYLSLLKDKTKNPERNTANQLAKNGLGAESEAKYYSVYQSTGDFTAGYNAALLLQAQGKLTEAKSLMTELVNTTGDKRAVSGLRDIQYEIDQATRLKNQRAAAKDDEW